MRFGAPCGATINLGRQATIPHLTRSSLQLCLQRHGISRPPEGEGDKPGRKKFKRYPKGKLYLFVAIGRTSKFAYAELHDKAGKMAAVPYTIHTVLTDNGIQFTNRKQDR